MMYIYIILRSNVPIKCVYIILYIVYINYVTLESFPSSENDGYGTAAR